MRHARFDVADLALEGVALPLRAAYLLVAEADDAEHPHWECLAYAIDPAPLAQARYRVDVTTLDGRHLHGDAVLVRSVEGAHVLRGAGPLVGVADAELA
ncbi:MAG TPA: hypothetical protein VHK88_01350 [Aquihabitans sp.]|nr:hypothetical protein [Aquihabitans sp.]